MQTSRSNGTYTYMSTLVPIGVAAQEMGVHSDTLRRWEKAWRIEPAERTPGGKRRYDLAKHRHPAQHVTPSSRTTIDYTRVFTDCQKPFVLGKMTHHE